MPPSSPHILVLDNEPTLTAVIADILEADGYRVSIANDARTALDLAQKDAPTLVLADMMMPGMDGLGFLREFRRRNSAAPEIPVIFFTAFPEERVSRQLGACGFIQKPATREQLLQKVFDGVAIAFVNAEQGAETAAYAG